MPRASARASRWASQFATPRNPASPSTSASFRANQLLYAGVLAGNARWRTEVVPKVPTSTDAQREARAWLRLVKRDGKRGRDKLPDNAPLGWSARPGPNY